MSGDEHDVHLYETSGIREGNARVPLWLLGVIVTLFAFFAYFLVTQWNEQPSSAQTKSRR